MRIVNIDYVEEIKKLDEESPPRYDELLKRVLHDKKILSEGDKRYVKGGSWADGPAYLQIGSREAFDKNKQSCRIGFRVAISYDKKYEKYFPKKHWKPKGRN